MVVARIEATGDQGGGDVGRPGAVVLTDEDYDEADEGREEKVPVTVDMEDGERQLWHFGEQAYRKARETGMLVPA